MTQPTIIFEDSDILVLNKPAGVTVNRSDTTKEEETLQDFVEKHLGFSPYYSKEKVDTYNTEEVFKQRGGIVHRLDKETSGIIIVAKNPSSFSELQRQFKERIVKKTYTALVHGKVEPEVGEINVPVGRLPWNRKRFGVLADGRDAMTKYKVLKYYSCHPELDSGSIRKGIPGQARNDNILSFLELYPETGRTHQIRVHLQHIRHPIFADFLYAGRKTARNDRKILNRVFLHASKIWFKHPARHASQLAGVAGGPSSKEQLFFEAPLPPELETLLKTLG